MADRYCLQMVECNDGCGNGINKEDTGWLDIVDTDLVTENFIETPSDNPIKYRRIGKIVYLQGSFNFLIANGETQTAFQLPEGFRPSKHFSSVIAGKKGERLQKGQINIAENGNVAAHSMVDWVNNSIISGEATAFHLNISFPVD